MEYIKEFNEFNEEIMDIQSFCDINLAYLIDEDFKAYYNDGASVITIRKNNWGDSFRWHEVIDHVIPFLHILNEKNKIKNIILYVVSSHIPNKKPHLSYTLDKLENANLAFEAILTISIYLEKDNIK